MLKNWGLRLTESIQGIRIDFYLNQTNFTPDKITLEADTSNSKSGLTIAPATIAGQKSVTLDADGSSYCFQLEPNADTFQLQYDSDSTATTSTTNGIRNSSSQTQTSSIDISEGIEFTESVSSGILSTTEKVSFAEGWSNAWTRMKEVDSSQTESTSKSTVLK